MKNHYVDYEQILMGPADQFGGKLGDIFMGWRNEENVSCAGLADICARSIGEPKNPAVRRVAEAALKLADEKNNNPYHDHHHNREVAALTLAMLIRHKITMLEPEIDRDMAWLTLAGAAIHDYKHDGTSNKVNGIVKPMRLEMNALKQAEPVLREAGISWANWHTIYTVVLPTDITPTDEPSPSAQLKKIYNACCGGKYFYGHAHPMFVSVMCDPALATCAQIVSDADLGISAALNYEITQENCKKLCDETKGLIPWRPSSLKYYLNQVCEGFPGSHVGKSLLGASFNHIKRQNEHDMHLGISFHIG